MQDQNEPNFNKLFKSYNVDMATKLKSIGDFLAKEEEEVEEWLERIKIIGPCTGSSDEEMIYMGLLGIRGKAQSSKLSSSALEPAY